MARSSCQIEVLPTWRHGSPIQQQVHKSSGKIQMHWLGPYMIRFITNGSSVQLQHQDGILQLNLVNGI